MSHRAVRAGVVETWRSAPLAVKALLTGVFVSRLGGFLQIFIVLYLTHRGYSSTDAAGALTAYGGGVIVGLLTGGWLADRLGARRTILASMTGSAVLLLAVLHLGDYAAIAVTVAVIGAISQAYRPAAASLLSALTPADRQVMIGSMQQLALNVGATAAPLLGVLLINVSYRLLFYGEAAAALVYAIVAATLLPRRSDGIDAATAADRLIGKPSYLSVIADRRYLVFLAAVFVNALVYAQYVSTLPLFLRDHGQPTSTYGALLALNSVVVIVGQLPATRLVEGWPARTAAVAGVLLTAVGMTLYGPWWGIAGLVVATLVWSVAECVGTPTVFFSYPVQAAPPLLRGRYLGSVQAIFAAGYAVGPSAGVAVWTASGNAVWWWCGVAGAISVAAMWVAIPVTRAGSATRAPGVEIGAGARAQT